MSLQAEMCGAVADMLARAFAGIAGVTVVAEDSCDPSAEAEKALGRFGVLVMVAASGHRRKPGTGAATAGDLSMVLTVMENPKRNRKSGTDNVPTVTSVAEGAMEALHWRKVAGRRIVYVDMRREDVADDDFRMVVSFLAPLALDLAHAVSWGIGEATVLGEVTKKTVARGGVSEYEPGRDGDARYLGTRDRHWRIALECTVTTQSEDDLPEIGAPFEYGGRTYFVNTAEMASAAEDTATVRLTGRTMKAN